MIVLFSKQKTETLSENYKEGEDMYLHLGADISVNQKYIVGIFDLDNTSTSKITREYLNTATKENKVINVSEEDLPRSFIVIKERGIEKVYVSPISSHTLSKRANIFEI